MDISAFLAMAEGWDGIKLKPLPHKIAVHEPCSLRNVLRGSRMPIHCWRAFPMRRLCRWREMISAAAPPGHILCDQPEMAQALLHDKITAMSASGARYLATSNIGCAMHIASALRESRPRRSKYCIRLRLLARQMGMPLKFNLYIVY